MKDTKESDQTTPEWFKGLEEDEAPPKTFTTNRDVTLGDSSNYFSKKSDDEILAEVGVDVEVDERYDTVMSADRKALAQDLHRNLGEAFIRIAQGSDARRTVTTRQLEGMDFWDAHPEGPFSEVVSDPLADEIEKEVYNQLESSGRYVGEDEVKSALADAAVKYRSEVTGLDLNTGGDYGSGFDFGTVDPDAHGLGKGEGGDPEYPDT